MNGDAGDVEVEREDDLQACPECLRRDGHSEGCSVGSPTPEIAAKRVEMERKLQAVQIDASRRYGRRSLPAKRPTATTVDDSTRLSIAKDILLAMIDRGGDKFDKVRAAVEYADLLLSELEVVS